MNNIYMYNTCFLSRSLAAILRATIQLLRKNDPFFGAGFTGVGIAASGGLSRGIWREKAVDAGPKTGRLEAE